MLTCDNNMLMFSLKNVYHLNFHMLDFEGEGKLYYPTGGKFKWSPLHVTLLYTVQH